MTQLEQTIVTTARQHQEALATHYYPKQKAGFTSADFEAEYTHHRYALITLLIFAHQTDSGIGREAASELLLIEQKDAADLTAGFEKPLHTERDDTTRALP
nr:hypothetical protein [Pseudomonas syringae]